MRSIKEAEDSAASLHINTYTTHFVPDPVLLSILVDSSWPLLHELMEWIGHEKGELHLNAAIQNVHM